MISILIPCYDFNALPLVKRLEKEALTLSIAYEIICIDDGSFSPLNENNQQINALTNCLFIESKKNVGRIANRKLLSDKAQYNWLLFIDVDTTPKNEKFFTPQKFFTPSRLMRISNVQIQILIFMVVMHQ